MKENCFAIFLQIIISQLFKQLRYLKNLFANIGFAKFLIQNWVSATRKIYPNLFSFKLLHFLPMSAFQGFFRSARRAIFKIFSFCKFSSANLVLYFHLMKLIREKDRSLKQALGKNTNHRSCKILRAE